MTSPGPMDRPFQLFSSEPSTQILGAAADEPESDAPCIRRGTCLGRYVIFQCLGSGGMGNVFAAYDPELDRRVALKVLRADLWRSEHGDAAKHLLLREARAAAQLSHPHVVSLYDVGTVDDRLFLTMELIDGATLAEWLELVQPDWKQTLDVLVQAGEGLAAAHHAAIAHRDFKPANLMITNDGKAKVVDFGLARALGETRNPTSTGATETAAPPEPSLDPPDSPSLVLAGPNAGTPAYMAPEQRRGKVADERSDQFSFCLTAYQALFGESPFKDHRRGATPDPGEPSGIREPPAGSPVPSRIRRALLRGLAFDPAARHPSMEALLEELRHPPERRRKWLIAALGLVIVAEALASFHQARIERHQLCGGAEQRLAEIWDSPQKKSLSRAMLATGSPHAMAAWHRVESRVDDYTRSWTKAYTEVCEATHLRGEQSPALLDRQMTCLDQRLAEIASLSSWLRRAGPREVDQAVGVAASLSSITFCVDRQQALHALAPPDPAIAPRVTAIRQHLAEAKTAQAAGGYSQAVELASAGLEAAQELGYAPLRAEAHLRLGLAHGRLGQAEELRHHLSRAVSLGLSAEHRQIVARAMVYQMAYGFMARDPGYSRLWAEMAEGAIEAAGGPPAIEAQRLLMLGITAEKEEQYEAAIDHYRAALETAPEKTLLLRGSVLNNIGRALQRLGSLEAAERHMRRAITVTEQAYGPWHPLVGYSLESLADLLDDRGEIEEAIDLRRRVLEILEVAPGPGHPVFVEILLALGRDLLVIDRADQAKPYLERARGLLTSQEPRGTSAAELETLDRWMQDELDDR